MYLQTGISIAPSIKTQMLDDIYNIVCESKITFGNEVWGLNEVLKESDEVLDRFCNKLMGIPNGAAIVFAEMGLGRVGEASV